MLFTNQEFSTDHAIYRNLRNNFRPDVVSWCEATFERARNLLDKDFIDRFRQQTPQRLSELWFAGAFLDAGWQPLARVVGFDLAFSLGSGRLLVEITTPDPHSRDTWTETKGDGYKIYEFDDRTKEAALRRLTGGFLSKACAIRERLSAGEITESDYVVIAISGFQLSQNTPYSPWAHGVVPDFAKAFLPVGSRHVVVAVDDPDGKPVDLGWQFKATLEQKGKVPVDRNAFLRKDFQHIHAVVYSPLHLGEPLSPIAECGALHNPMARPKDQAVPLGMGHEYGVELGDDHFSISPIQRH